MKRFNLILDAFLILTFAGLACTFLPKPGDPGATPTPTVAATPAPTLVPCPSGPTEKCTPPWPNGRPINSDSVLEAINAVKIANPGWVTPNGKGIVKDQTLSFDFAVAAYLRAHFPLDVIVDSCNCDTIELSIAGSSGPDAYYEEYALLVSSGDIRNPNLDGFRGRCTPRCFMSPGTPTSTAAPTLTPTPGPTFTPSPSPTPTPRPTGTGGCGTLIKIGMTVMVTFPLGDLQCIKVDHTARFLGGGCPRSDGCPSNQEHHEYFPATCDVLAGGPDITSKVNKNVLKAFQTPHKDGDPPNVWRGSITNFCGTPGTIWKITGDITPGALNQQGNPIMKAPNYLPFIMKGTF